MEKLEIGKLLSAAKPENRQRLKILLKKINKHVKGIDEITEELKRFGMAESNNKER